MEKRCSWDEPPRVTTADSVEPAYTEPSRIFESGSATVTPLRLTPAG
jgi:hypothetical protein